MSDKLAGGIKAGSTSVSLPVELRKTSDSTEQTGKVYTDVTGSYLRQGGTRTAITMATLGSVNAAWSSGGFVEIDATNQPGLYRFDVPDAAFATGADWVVISVKVSSCFVVHFIFALETIGAAELGARIPAALTADGNIKADTLRVNGTAQTARDLGGQLDAAVTSRMATFTLPTNFSSLVIDANGRVDLSKVLGATINALISGRVDANAQVVGDKTGYALTSGERTSIANEVEAQIIDETDSEKVLTAITDKIAASNPSLAGLTLGAIAAAVRDVLIAGAAANSLGAAVSAVKAKTDLIPAAGPPSAADYTSARATKIDNLDAAISTRSSHTAADVWTSTTRTLSSFGTLIADLWAKLTSQLTTSGSIGKLIVDNLDATVSSRSDATVAGSGAFAVTVTVTDGSSALQNATVRLTEGINSFTAITNVNGVASFNLNAATYAIGITKSGYQFTPATIAVSTSANFDKAMTAIVIAAPADPNQATGSLTTFDAQGAIAAAVVLKFEMVTGPGSNSYKISSFTATSDNAGLLTAAFRKGAKYRGSRGGVNWVEFTVPTDASTFALPEILGTP